LALRQRQGCARADQPPRERTKDFFELITFSHARVGGFNKEKIWECLESYLDL
jgi:hypothetical protein